MARCIGGHIGYPPTSHYLGRGIVGELPARELYRGARYSIRQQRIPFKTVADIMQRMWTCDWSRVSPSSSRVWGGRAWPPIPGRTRWLFGTEVSNMRPGSVIIDVSIDRGLFWNVGNYRRMSIHLYEIRGWYIYCVPNIPSGFARTAHRPSAMCWCPCCWSRRGGWFWKPGMAPGTPAQRAFTFQGRAHQFFTQPAFRFKDTTDLNLLIASSGKQALFNFCGLLMLILGRFSHPAGN